VPSAQLRFYEDYPYAAQPGAVDAALEDDTRWESTVVPLDEAALAAKIEAVAAYRSQISSFWPDRAAMAAALRAHALATGGERFWRVAD
jgi:hypothetical protein